MLLHVGWIPSDKHSPIILHSQRPIRKTKIAATSTKTNDLPPLKVPQVGLFTCPGAQVNPQGEGRPENIV